MKKNMTIEIIDAAALELIRDLESRNMVKILSTSETWFFTEDDSSFMTAEFKESDDHSSISASLELPEATDSAPKAKWVKKKKKY